jgi:site-specific DNA-methyltransferase (adenine-specific)
MAEPYYQDDRVTLYHGRFEKILPTLREEIDLIIADPPYAETSLEWDSWPNGWPSKLIGYGAAMWCFGSMRMFLERREEFADWRLSQDCFAPAIWEKQNGTGFTTDRFKRVHEHLTHWYRGPWEGIHHEVPRYQHDGPDKTVLNRGRTPHTGVIGSAAYRDDGRRMARSVIYAPNMHGRAINETQKPEGLLAPLIEYGCPPGGMVLDPFAGSCSTLIAARHLGRRAIGIEAREDQCESAARWLSAQPLF